MGVQAQWTQENSGLTDGKTRGCNCHWKYRKSPALFSKILIMIRSCPAQPCRPLISCFTARSIRCKACMNRIGSTNAALCRLSSKFELQTFREVTKNIERIIFSQNWDVLNDQSEHLQMGFCSCHDARLMNSWRVCLRGQGCMQVLLYQLVKGVAYPRRRSRHGGGTMHRNLKPSNSFLNTNPQNIYSTLVRRL